MLKGGERVQNLKEICEEWAPRLGLAHWEIAVRWADEKGLEKMTPWAESDVKFKPCAEKAVIRVKREGDYKQLDRSERHDVEAIVVHELLHLVFSHFPDGEDDGIKDSLFDIGIDRIAKCLVKLKNCPCGDGKGGEKQ